MAEIAVTQEEEGTYAVEVTDGDSASRHRVTVTGEERERFGGGGDPERLIRESFRFLLEREPKEAILSSFRLSTIERYFPEYPERIRARLEGS